MSLLVYARRGIANTVRARQIAEVLLRNGLGFVVDSLGLSRYVFPRRARRSNHAQPDKASMPKRVRKTLEDLGPAYIKLGQVLSTRPDILPPEYALELSNLLDAATPVPADAIQAVIEQELGSPVDKLYASFDPQPIAAASIGQVHMATLADGTRVAVKVQRPGVEETVRADLSLLLAQARLVSSRSEFLRDYGLVELLNEFSQALLDELDYTVEGRNAERLGRLVATDGVIVPKIHWELSTRRVITMQALTGLKLTEVAQLRAVGYDLSQVAEQVAQAYMSQVFTHGMFHGDPHPANILIQDGKVGLVDFGVVGYMTAKLREQLGDLVMALMDRNIEEMLRVMVRMGASDRALRDDALVREGERLMVRYFDASLGNIDIAEFLGELMTLAFKHKVRLPANLALLARVVMQLEGVVRTLDPNFVLTDQLKPIILQLARERISFKRLTRRAVKNLRDLDMVLGHLPARVDIISEQLARGDFDLGVELRHLDRALQKADAIGNRLSFAVIVAALLIGSALVLAAGEQAATFAVPLLNVDLPIAQIGFVLAGLSGFWLIFSIIRSRGL